jgi:hypothetical protein
MMNRIERLRISCSNCDYGVQTSGLGGDEWKCRRRAPTGSMVFGTGVISPEHPSVAATHWCGEHSGLEAE